MEDTPRSPLLAVNVLMDGLAEVQHAIALDRARCEAWLIAAQAACGADVEPLGPNPLTGQPYDFERQGNRIIVRHLQGDRDESVAVTVPVQS